MVALFRCKSAFYIFVYRIATKNYRKSIALRQKIIATKKSKQSKEKKRKEIYKENKFSYSRRRRRARTDARERRFQKKGFAVMEKPRKR